METAHSPPGGPEEDAAFASIQARFPDIYQTFDDPAVAKTIVVVPSMSLDQEELSKIRGAIHYEERLLVLLMLLRYPRTHVVYVTSTPIDDRVIDYYLSLIPGIPGEQARSRLRLITVDDPSIEPLTKKLLERPEIVEQLKGAIEYPETAHMTCFNTTAFEKTLSVQLGIPIYGCDPALSHLGSKSASREIFREVDLETPDGYENLSDEGDIIEALVSLNRRNPTARELVLKLNDGFSGEGNAVVPVGTLPESPNPRREAANLLRTAIRFEADGETWESYLEKFSAMEGIVEVLLEGEHKESPSVQMNIDPLGETTIVSTHDQVLAGPSGQIFQGCCFPARKVYRQFLHQAGRRVVEVLRDRGVLGRVGVDFVSVAGEGGWRHYAIEINIRKGGTTLPFMTLESLTNGTYHPETGSFITPTGDVRSYYATDNLVRDSYCGLTPADLIDSAVLDGLHYDATAQQGVVFHMLGALREHGKVGVLSIASHRSEASRQYEKTVQKLEAATR